MISSLQPARIKLARAEEHLRVLGLEVQRYLGSRPYEITTTAEAGEEGPSLVIRRPLPLTLTGIAGDCLYNLRASLELTYWALALQTGPKDPDRDRVSFPIFVSPAKFQAAQEGFAHWVTEDALVAITKVQPFRTQSRALSMLRRLSNLDRHGYLGLDVVPVSVVPAMTIGVTFAEAGLQKAPVESVLLKIAQHIKRDVLPVFDPLFGSTVRVEAGDESTRTVGHSREY